MGILSIPIISGALSLFKMGGQLFDNWQKKKLVKAEGKIEIEKAKVKGKIKHAERVSEGQIDYNKIAAQGMATSYKDEIFVITWLAILVGIFLPWTQAYVKEGFVFLKTNTPWWYVTGLIGMITASFGLKGWKMWKQNGGNNGGS